MIYIKDSEFTHISKANVASYEVLLKREGLLFLLHPGHLFGFVFSEEEVHSAYQHVPPVMRIGLSDTCLGCKWVRWLRIREGFSGLGIASQWYLSYVDKHGGIVSAKDHNEESRGLWKSLLEIARTNPQYTLWFADLTKEEVLGDATDISLEQLWSTDTPTIDLALILKKTTKQVSTG